MEQINIGKHNVSVSIGIAIMPSDGNDFKDLYNKADKALYYVKQNGKCGYHLFNEKEKYLIQDNIILSDKEINIDNLLDMFGMDHIDQGAFGVEYYSFKRIIEFVSRCIKRSQQEVQLVLFTFDNYEDIPHLSE